MKLDLPSSVRLTTWGIMIIFTILIAGSFVFKTEVTVKGKARTLPEENIWKIQSKTDGFVAKYNIFEGKFVNKGDILLELKNDIFLKDINNLEQALEELKCHNQSVDFLLSLNAKELSSKLSLDQGKFSQCEQLQISVSHTNVLEKLNKFKLEEIQYANQIKNLKEEKLLLQDMVHITEEDLTRKKALFEKKLISATNLGETQKEYLQLKQYLSEVDTNILLALHNKEQAQKSQTLEISNQRYLWANEKTRLFQEISEKKSLLDHARDNVTNSIIKAPISGIIDKKEINGEGDFISAGSDIVFIVPSGGELVARVYFENRDIGLIKQGQKAWIKLDAFPIERYELLKGKVIRVSSESVMQDEKWLYFVDIKLEKQYVEKDNIQYKLKSGMTGEADIIVGKRQLIAFLFEPVFRSLHEVAKEP